MAPYMAIGILQMCFSERSGEGDMILDYPGGPISSQSLLQEEEEGTGSESETGI